MPLIKLQLDDSDAADHACFADSTDVFSVWALSGTASWRVQGIDLGPKSLTCRAHRLNCAPRPRGRSSVG
jgi:hypothetical protein